MTDHQHQKYAFYTKVAWAIYALIAAIVIAILVLVVAQDNEEKFFYGLMAAAVSYVFRPTADFISGMIFRFTGVAKPTAPTIPTAPD